jgi:hypothetical protein
MTAAELETPHCILIISFKLTVVLDASVYSSGCLQLTSMQESLALYMFAITPRHRHDLIYIFACKTSVTSNPWHTHIACLCQYRKLHAQKVIYYD